MNRLVAALITFALTIGPAVAQRGGTGVAANLLACPTPQALLTNTSGYVASSAALTANTFIGIVLGQSIGGDHQQGFHTVAQDVRMVNVCGDGQVYVHKEPMLGTSFTAGGYQGFPNYGTMWGDVGDLMITGGTTSGGKTFDRVFWINQSYAGQPISTFMPNGSTGYNLALSFKTLSALGITPDKVSAILVDLGESDGINGTSQASYQAQMQTWFSIAKGLGFTGKWLVALETYAYGCTNSTIRAAQAAVVDGVTVFQGPDLDTLVTTTNRYAEVAAGGCAINALVHFNSTGRAAAAALWKSAIFSAF